MNIAVIGSINTDVIYQVDKIASKGETLFGNNYQIKDGGKGANQAVILNSLEDNVVFFGAIGTDIFGETSKMNLLNKGLNAQIIQKEGNSGLAIIHLANDDNSITVFKGANDKITKEDIDSFLDDNKNLDIIVLQLEINLQAITYLIEKAYESGIKIVLNPAPAIKLDLKLLDKIEYFIPNETEAESIFESNDLQQIVTKYSGKVIITLGDKGVMYFNGEKTLTIPAQNIKVIDTTGAGDSFIAGFTSGITNNLPLKDAILKGINVASITCKHLGAQTSYQAIKAEYKI